MKQENLRPPFQWTLKMKQQEQKQLQPSQKPNSKSSQQHKKIPTLKQHVHKYYTSERGLDLKNKKVSNESGAFEDVPYKSGTLS